MNWIANFGTSCIKLGVANLIKTKLTTTLGIYLQYSNQKSSEVELYTKVLKREVDGSGDERVMYSHRTYRVC